MMVMMGYDFKAKRSAEILKIITISVPLSMRIFMMVMMDYDFSWLICVDLKNHNNQRSSLERSARSRYGHVAPLELCLPIADLSTDISLLRSFVQK